MYQQKYTLSDPYNETESYPHFTGEKAKAQRCKQLSHHGTAGQQVVRGRATVSSFYVP